MLASIMLFWIAEVFLWFVCNPAYGLEKFNLASVSRDKHWIGVAPTDYWMSLAIASILLWLSARSRQ